MREGKTERRRRPPRNRAAHAREGECAAPRVFPSNPAPFVTRGHPALPPRAQDREDWLWGRPRAQGALFFFSDLSRGAAVAPSLGPELVSRRRHHAGRLLTPRAPRKVAKDVRLASGACSVPKPTHRETEGRHLLFCKQTCGHERVEGRRLLVFLARCFRARKKKKRRSCTQRQSKNSGERAPEPHAHARSPTPVLLYITPGPSWCVVPV